MGSLRPLKDVQAFLKALASFHSLSVVFQEMQAGSHATATTDIQELLSLQQELQAAADNNTQVAQDYLAILNRQDDSFFPGQGIVCAA